MLKECWQVSNWQWRQQKQLQQVAHHHSTITSTVPSQRWLPQARLISSNAFRPLLAILRQAIALRPQTGTQF